MTDVFWYIYTDGFDIFCAISMQSPLELVLCFKSCRMGYLRGCQVLADSVPDGTNCVLWWRGSWHPLMPPNYFICPIWLSPSNISLMESFHVGDNKSMLLRAEYPRQSGTILDLTAGLDLFYFFSGNTNFKTVCIIFTALCEGLAMLLFFYQMNRCQWVI